VYFRLPEADLITGPVNVQIVNQNQATYIVVVIGAV